MKTLSEDNQRLIRQCLVAIAEGPFIEEAEFQTRLGINREELRYYISTGSLAAETEATADIVVNNCLNEVSHGIHFSATEWARWFVVPRETIRDFYLQWHQSAFDATA